jgi:hypothetical protein
LLHLWNSKLHDYNGRMTTFQCSAKRLRESTGLNLTGKINGDMGILNINPSSNWCSAVDEKDREMEFKLKKVIYEESETSGDMVSPFQHMKCPYTTPVQKFLALDTRGNAVSLFNKTTPKSNSSNIINTCSINWFTLSLSY